MILRCTQKLLRRMHEVSDAPVASPAGLLGDWHATLLVLRPTWLVLMLNDATRLPVLLPAREFVTLRQRIPGAVAAVLNSLAIDPAAIQRERAALQAVTVARSANRSVLGTINDFAFQLEWFRQSQAHESPLEWSLRLARTPVGPLASHFPDNAVRRLPRGRTQLR